MSAFQTNSVETSQRNFVTQGGVTDKNASPITPPDIKTLRGDLFYLNLRFVGVGFRGYIIKKVINVQKLSVTQKRIASR